MSPILSHFIVLEVGVFIGITVMAILVSGRDD